MPRGIWEVGADPPLRSLLQAAADAASDEELAGAAEAIKRAQAKIADLSLFPPHRECC